MADWLKQCGIRTVAMQSTGVYWIAVCDILEQAALEVYLERVSKTPPERNPEAGETEERAIGAE
jgi:hypothetical protein